MEYYLKYSITLWCNMPFVAIMHLPTVTSSGKMRLFPFISVTDPPASVQISIPAAASVTRRVPGDRQNRQFSRHRHSRVQARKRQEGATAVSYGRAASSGSDQISCRRCSLRICPAGTVGETWMDFLLHRADFPRIAVNVSPDARSRTNAFWTTPFVAHAKDSA